MNDDDAPAAAPSEIEVRLLGGLGVRLADGHVVKPAEWRTAKTAALIRILALHPDRPADTEALVNVLWPKAESSRGEASLRTAVWHLRQVLGQDHVERSRAGIQLSAVWVDVVAYQALTSQIRRLVDTRMFADVADLARQASALYRGALDCTGISAEPFLTEARGLAIEHQALLCNAAEAALETHHPRQAAAYARSAIAADQFDERACRLLMKAHMDLGETSFALREYDRCRRLLADELGVDPAPQTTAVYQAVLHGQRGVGLLHG